MRSGAALVIAAFVVAALGAAFLLREQARRSSAAGEIASQGTLVAGPDSDAPVMATPPPGFEPYIFRMSGERADPVNLIFLHTDAPTVAATIERVLGWRPVVASNMQFKRGDRLRPTSRQLAAEVGGGSRYHIRIQAVPITDTQWWVLASVHRDDTAACGHVGRAFDETRDLVARALREAGMPTGTIDLDNDASGLHCDGSRVPGDGRAVLVDLSRVPRVDTSRGRIVGVE
jgi:hypothetical protein